MSLRTDTRLNVRRNVDLSRCTTMHVGGPAEYFAEPETFDELRELLDFAHANKLPVMFLGRGSNVIFSDSGYPGLIVGMNRYELDQAVFHVDQCRVEVSAGVQLHKFVLLCRDHGLGGCEFLSSIPGSIGGALLMNAGFSRFPGQLNQISDVVESVTVLEAGQKKVVDVKDLDYAYRHSNLRGKIILGGTFKLIKKHRDDIDREIKANFEYRGKVQDVRYPSSGSIFKNPSKAGLTAGKLIDGMGLKGLRVGDAMVSFEHANYMINLGHARGSDFIELIAQVKKAVLDGTGIVLETEVVLA